jgi:hypothetical protein
LSQGLVHHRGALGGDNLVENEGEHEDSSQMRLLLSGRADVEAPRVVLVGIRGGVGSRGRGTSFELVPGADVGGYVSGLPVGHAETRHVLLRARLPFRAINRDFT